MQVDSEEIHHASAEGMEEEQNCLRFFLMGKTGAGKSATGNTILGKNKFKSEASLKSVTNDVELLEAEYGEHVIKVMDSPGLFDTEQSEAEVAGVLVKAVATLHPGPHVLLFVVRFGRYTLEDHAVYSRLKALLDDRIRQHTIVVFTHADELSSSQTASIQQVISDGPENLKQLMADCDNRFVLFNNNADDKQPQLKNLMDKVLKLKNNNHHRPYQCPRYAYVSEMIEEETKKRLEEVEKKELERSQHYRRLEEQLKQRDRELVDREKELERRAQELESREQEEVKRLLGRIQVLEQQLASQSNQTTRAGNVGPQQPAGEPDPRVAAFEQQVTDLTSKVQSLQRDLTNERQNIENKNSVEINIMAERDRMEKELKDLKEIRTQEDKQKKDLEAKLEELTKNDPQDDEEKNKLREELEELRQKHEQYDALSAQLTQQQRFIEELQRSNQERDERQNNEQRLKDNQLAAAQTRIQELQAQAQAQQDKYDQPNGNKNSSICAIL